MNDLNIPIIYCSACGEQLLNPEKEFKNNQKYYHKKCLKCIKCGETNETSEILKEKDVYFIDDKIYCKMHYLSTKYSGQYFQHTLISKVGIPYYKTIKCHVIKNCFSELIPKISLYFNISEEQAKLFVKQGGIIQVKKELQAILDEDICLYLDSYEISSLFLTFALGLKKLGKKIKNIFVGKNKETKKIIANSIKLIENKKLKCLNEMTPNSVTFVNQKSFENSEENKKKIKEFLSDKVSENSSNKSNSTNSNTKKDSEILSVLSDATIESVHHLPVTKEDEELILNDLEIILENNEKEICAEMKIVEKTSQTNADFEKEFELALKNSIFEFRKTGLIIVNKDNQFKIYQSNKSACPNLRTKFLYHGTKIEYSAEILPSNFKVGRDCWYGLGIYFTDQIDYARYYWNGWSTENSCINKIPKEDELFSLVVSEVYYDSSKFIEITDLSKYVKLDHFPDEDEIFKKYKDKIVKKNGIHYVEVDGESTNVYDYSNNKILKCTEYVITYQEQIHPLYGLTLQRVEYCIIWQDPNFAGGKYQHELLERKKYANQMTNFNIYYEVTSEDALKLIWRKKYNKIILISNCGHNFYGRNFVDKARKILGFNVMVLFFGNWIGHLDWIKDYPNSLFTNNDLFYRDYIRNFNEQGLLKLKNNIENFIHLAYAQYSNFKFKDFENHLDYPLYKTGGQYSDLDCSEYSA